MKPIRFFIRSVFLYLLCSVSISLASDVINKEVKIKILPGYTEYEIDNYSKLVLFKSANKNNSVMYQDGQNKLIKNSFSDGAQFVFSTFKKNKKITLIVNKFNGFKKTEFGLIQSENLKFNKTDNKICKSSDFNFFQLRDNVDDLSGVKLNIETDNFDSESCSMLDSAGKRNLSKSVSYFFNNKSSALASCLQNDYFMDFLKTDVYMASFIAQFKSKSLTILNNSDNLKIKCLPLSSEKNIKGLCQVSEDGSEILISSTLSENNEQLNRTLIHEMMHASDPHHNTCFAENVVSQFENICQSENKKNFAFKNSDIILKECKDDIKNSNLSVINDNSRVKSGVVGQGGLGSAIVAENLSNIANTSIIKNLDSLAVKGNVEDVAKATLFDVNTGKAPIEDGSSKTVVAISEGFNSKVSGLASGFATLSKALNSVVDKALDPNIVTPINPSGASLSQKSNITILTESQTLASLYASDPSKPVVLDSPLTLAAKHEMATEDENYKTKPIVGVVMQNNSARQVSAMAEAGKINGEHRGGDRSPASEVAGLNINADRIMSEVPMNMNANAVSSNKVVAAVNTNSAQGLVQETIAPVQRLPAQTDVKMLPTQAAQILTSMKIVSGHTYLRIREEYPKEEFREVLKIRRTAILDLNKERIAGDIDPKICFIDDGKILKKLESCPKQ